MVYISSDGSALSKKPPPSRNPIKVIHEKITPPVAIGIVALLIAASKSTLFDFNPLSKGKIPAAKKDPNEHWNYLEKDVSFVRTMTDGIAAWKAKFAKKHTTPKEVKKLLDEHEMQMKYIEGVDFGGMDGHVPEGTDLLDLEEIRVTRCSTTRSALTAYFCGVDVATNQDAALGLDGKGYISGTKSFKRYLKCRHQQGMKNGGIHKRSVYRLGVSCKDDLAGYSHAFSIVSQPDGTFYWLQSYISHYSLSTWMKKVDHTKQSGLAGKLTYHELISKLNTIDRLMRIDSWTTEANDDYLDLFNVDKNLERMKEGNRGRQIKKWTDDHRLDTFVWDEACEYPLLKTDDQTNGQDTEEEMAYDLPKSDNCTVLLSLYNSFSME